MDTYKVGGTRFSSYTKEDNRKLQVLQNKVARLMLVKKSSESFSRDKQFYNMSTKELLVKSGDLSIQQLGAFQTIMMTKKIILNGKPEYLADRLQWVGNRGTRSGSILPEKKTTLGLKKEGFVHRGIQLYNMLPEELKCEEKILKFKAKTKNWVKLKIAVKP